METATSYGFSQRAPTTTMRQVVTCYTFVRPEKIGSHTSLDKALSAAELRNSGGPRSRHRVLTLIQSGYYDTDSDLPSLPRRTPRVPGARARDARLACSRLPACVPAAPAACATAANKLTHIHTRMLYSGSICVLLGLPLQHRDVVASAIYFVNICSTLSHTPEALIAAVVL